jgi:hypothetical protein
MLNPTLGRKEEKRLTVNMASKRLFQVVFRSQKKQINDDEQNNDDEDNFIKVSELISKMSFYYEKIRNSVDYKEEHLLRKNAIERILKRQIVIEGSITVKNANSIAKHLITELIRAAYLPNNKVKKEKINEIALILERYLNLRKYSHPTIKTMNLKEKSEMVNWILAIAASDIEENLGRSKIDLTVVDYMYQILTKYIVLPKNIENTKDREIQIFLAIHRNFLKFDRDMLTFILLKYYNENWLKAQEDDIKKVGDKILGLRKVIERQLDHPLAAQLNRIASRYNVFFTILLDIIKEDPKGVYESFQSNPGAFTKQIKKMANARYKDARTKLWRAAFRSIIYIFVTKSIFVFILEVPASKFLGEVVNPVALGINIVFPAFLLFLVILFTRLPGEANTQRIIEGVNEIVFEENERKENFSLRKPAKRGKILNLVFGLIYLVFFFFTFGAVVLMLDKIGFNFINITIFLFFLAFISFFSIRIRKSAKEFLIVEPKESILGLFIDFFYIPIVQAGKWLSEKFSRVNVFVFLLDFVFEAPFKIFVEIAEEWTKYVRERKEDIV